MKASPRGRLIQPARRPFALFLSLLVVASAVAFAPAGGSRAARQDETASEGVAPKGGGAEFVPGEALVRFRSEEEAEPEGAEATVEVADSPAGAFAAKQKVTARFRRFDGSDIVRGLRLVKLSKGDSSAADPKQTLAAIRALSRRPDVLYAEPNYIRRARAVPNDTNFGQQYAMQRISAPAAWDTTKGSRSVVVAVIDTGVNLQHPDLVDNAWTNPGEVAGNGVDDDGNGFVDDVNGWDFSTCTSTSPTSPAVCGNNTVFDDPSNDDHGTHVAGIIGARGNNGQGVTGVNWEVSIMSVKVLGPDGGDTEDIIRAYNYVRLMRQRGVNVRVTNNSYGGPGFSQASLDAINALNDAGVLVVVAAGNAGRDIFNVPEFPANYSAPNLIAVASTNSNTPDGISGFSNFSSRLVSIGAPGASILSTIPTAQNPNSPYGVMSGTSMSTPHVSGAAALLLAARADLSVAHLRGSLAFTGDRLEALRDNTTTGRRLNVRAALDAALSNDTAAPNAAAMTLTGQSGRSVTLSLTAPGDDGSAGTAADYDFFFVNPTTGLRVPLPSNLVPAPAGTQQSVTVAIPFRNLSGSVELRAYDDRGNVGVSTVPVTVQQNPVSDPYIVTTGPAEPLSTGGEWLQINGDDKYLSGFGTGYVLPFIIDYFGEQRNVVLPSTNGVLYFVAPGLPDPPRRDNGDSDDAGSSVEGLQGLRMIAGLWDDLDLRTCFRPDAGIYVVKDSEHIIFRWQGVRFQSLACPSAPGGSPVNFEIEIKRDGTIITRYGTDANANANMTPVVGIGGGEPSAYDVPSHTSESGPLSLGGAPTVTFTRRTTSGPGLGAVQFSTASFAQSEAAGRAVLTVTRSGDMEAAGSVQVRTVDDPASVRCDDTTTAPGVAFARCDYSTTVETLTFAPGEFFKTFTVPLVNDAHVEPAERVNVLLFSPAGNLVLGAQATIALTITSDDSAGAANPIDGPPHDFFVRQHYLDFLSREPEASGLEAWLKVLNPCANAFNHDGAAPSAACDRNTVSSAFFRSAEFEIKGAYVFRLYRVAFNRLPLYAEMIPDMRAVTGQTEQEVFQKKAAFAAQLAARPEFQTAYGQADAAQFVNTLMNRYGLQQITTHPPYDPDGTLKITLTRQQLIDALHSSLPRAQILRAIADSDEVAAAERDRTFVAMQYFGYLRRDPDQGGFDAWMNYLATHPGDYYTMVNGFLYSGEYRLRFGS